jgi:hypothetical protein
MLQIYIFLTLVIVALIILSIDIKIYGLKGKPGKCKNVAININESDKLPNNSVFDSLNNGIKNIYKKFYNTDL